MTSNLKILLQIAKHDWYIANNIVKYEGIRMYELIKKYSAKIFIF